MNIQVARSRDLRTWHHLGDALPEKPRWATGTQNFWAPHVIRDGDAYYMYYSAEPDTARGRCLGVATAVSPAGPFADSGVPLLCGPGIEHIDPMAFDDPRTGERLLYWGSGSTPIKVQPLAADRLSFLPGSAPKALLFPDAREFRRLIEGAWVIFREGWYYLFYSGDNCCSRNPRYAVMVARAREAQGPYEALPEPILAPGEHWIAPGHNSVIADAAGNDWIVYHAARPGEHWSPRLMLIDRIVWRDGWPAIEGRAPSAGPQRAPALGR
jgi:arabinan endo-1,5-alpha-L-arabinosidase